MVHISTGTGSWHKIIKYADGTAILLGHKEFTNIDCNNLVSGWYQSGQLYFSDIPAGIIINNVVANTGIGSLDARVSYHRTLIDGNAIRTVFKSKESIKGINTNVSIIAYGTWAET